MNPTVTTPIRSRRVGSFRLRPGRVARTAAEGAAIALDLGSRLMLDLASLIGEAPGKTESTAGPASPVSIPSETPGATISPGRSEQLGRDTPHSEQFERLFDAALQQEGIGTDGANAAVVVVGRGGILFSKGYGAEEGSPDRQVSVDRTPFQVASGTTIFLATATEMGIFLISLLGRSETPPSRASQNGEPLYRHRFVPFPRVRQAVIDFYAGRTSGRHSYLYTGGGVHRSLIFLLPDEGLGLYAVVGGVSQSRAFQVRQQLLQEFLRTV